MKVQFTEDGWASYISWLDDDRRMLKRINRLIADIQRDDGTGIGRPELLHGDLAGLSSRRISEEHRLVYEVKDEVLSIVSCRYHYR